jgi:hypothetical protein
MKKLLLSVLIMGLVLCTGMMQAQAATIDFVPPSQTIFLGDPATVGMAVTLGANDLPLAGFDLFVAYDSTIVDFTGATYGTALLPSVQITSAAGSNPLEVFELSLGPGVATSPIDIVSLLFQGVGVGTSALNVLAGVPGTVALSLLSDLDGNPIAFTATPGSITVERIPEPATMLLLGGGLAGLFFLRRKQS